MILLSSKKVTLCTSPQEMGGKKFATTQTTAPHKIYLMPKFVVVQRYRKSQCLYNWGWRAWKQKLNKTMECNNNNHWPWLPLQTTECKSAVTCTSHSWPYLYNSFREHGYQEVSGYCADDCHVVGHLRALLDKWLDTLHRQRVAAHKAQHHFKGGILLTQGGVDLSSSLDLCQGEEKEERECNKSKLFSARGKETGEWGNTLTWLYTHTMQSPTVYECCRHCKPFTAKHTAKPPNLLGLGTSI